jgi:hypothetical protein
MESIMYMRSAIQSFTIVGALLVATTASAQRAGQHPDVAGTWRMDTTKFEKHDAALASLTLTVRHLGDTLLIVTDGVDVGRPPFQMTARYLPEGSIRAGAATDTSKHPSVLTWAGDTLVLRTRESRPGRTLNIEERWAIDPGGQTLTRLQHVVDETIGRVSQQTLVFTRP